MAPPHKGKAKSGAARRQQQQQRRRRAAAVAADPVRLLDEADAAAAAGDADAALTLAEAAVRAINAAADTAPADLLERAGVRFLELGEPDAALDCLLRCAAAAPDTGHAKYLYLAQLHSGEAALAHLDRGIAMLTAAAAEPAPDAAAAAASDAGRKAADDLASALCARCELYMTDLCDVPDAEAQCEAALASALSARPDSAEALQLRAGLRLVQQRPDEALADLRRSLDVWLPRRRQAADAPGADPDDCGLTGEQRLRCAEMLVELGQLDACLDVLDLLVEEDDEVAQVWLLFGLAYGRQGNHAAARYHLQRARALVEPGDPAAAEIDQLLAGLPPADPAEVAGGGKMAAGDEEAEAELVEEEGD